MEDVMDANKQARLVAAGWTVGTPADFLALSAAEAEMVEIRHRLAHAVRTKINLKLQQLL